MGKESVQILDEIQLPVDGVLCRHGRRVETVDSWKEGVFHSYGSRYEIGCVQGGLAGSLRFCVEVDNSSFQVT